MFIFTIGIIQFMQHFSKNLLSQGRREGGRGEEGEREREISE